MSGGAVLVPPFTTPLQPRSTPQQFLLPSSSPMASRKRKADEDLQDENMNRTSPSPPPNTPSRQQYSRQRPIKKPKTGLIGGPLPMSRLLETLNPDQLRTVLRSICDQHPQIALQIASAAPRPTVASVLSILSSYQESLRSAFPYGDRPSSEYAYNRVRQSLTELLHALRDYTPQFLPPHESQSTTSLEYLDGATHIIHQLPNWDSYQHNRHKQDAYEEMAQAWVLAIREAAKKGGGIQLQCNGWDLKISRHNNESGGRLQPALGELRACLGWMDGATTGRTPQDNPEDTSSIRQQLLSGTYGTSSPIQVGPW